MHLSYLAFLVFSLAGMVLCDHRWKLAFFSDAKRATAVVTGCVAAFLLWDSVGIATGTFARGESSYMLGIELAPEMPVEEPVFLLFLSYLTLNLTGAARKLVSP